LGCPFNCSNQEIAIGFPSPAEYLSTTQSLDAGIEKAKLKDNNGRERKKPERSLRSGFDASRSEPLGRVA